MKMDKMRKIIFAASAAMFAAAFCFSKEFARGTAEGLRLCAGEIVPSTFALMCAASLAGKGEMPDFIKKLFAPLMKLAGLPAEAFPAVLLGFAGGYTVGAVNARSLYDSGRLTAVQAEKLMLFCICPGVGFSVNVVGSGFLGSRKSGVLILLSVCIASLILMLFTAGRGERTLPDKCAETEKYGFPDALVSSVSSASQTMLSVCGTVALFSGICGAAELIPVNEKALLLLKCALEVTCGCRDAAGKMPLPLLAGVCGFGGICVQLQVLSVCRTAGADKKKFFLFRFIHAALSILICILLLELFPVELPTASIAAESFRPVSFSVPASVSLMFLCALLILDLDYNKRIC